jgi:hypothetical protein
MPAERAALASAASLSAFFSTFKYSANCSRVACQQAFIFITEGLNATPSTRSML